MAVGLDGRDALIQPAGRTVVTLETADDVADWLWADGETVAEIMIGSATLGPDLRETLRRDWPDITVREV